MHGVTVFTLSECTVGYHCFFIKSCTLKCAVIKFMMTLQHKTSCFGSNVGADGCLFVG